jgi:hypothetical protein
MVIKPLFIAFCNSEEFAHNNFKVIRHTDWQNAPRRAEKD